MSQKLRKIMVENIITVKPNDTIRRAAELMDLHGISSLVVIDSEKPVGIITERDMLNRVLNKPKTTTEARAAEIMSKPVVTAHPNIRAGDAAKLMIERNIKKLPIVENGRLVGLVSLTDLMRSDGIIQFLNKVSLNGASLRIKKTVNLFLDQERGARRKCPLITEQGFHLGCQENKCMWWTGEECAVTRLSRQFSSAEMTEVAIEP
jgi:CBS domain-containing protein